MIIGIVLDDMQHKSTLRDLPNTANALARRETAINDAADKPRWLPFIMLAGCMALWGGTWPVGRSVAQSVEPWNAAFLRFAFATTALVLICLYSQGKRAFRVSPRLLPQLMLLGFTGVFGYSFLFFSGLKTIGAGRAGLIIGCIPVCIAFCSAVMARRWLPIMSVIGIAMSLTGVAVVIADGSPLALLQGSIQAGDLMILGCVVCWTAYTLLARPVMKVIPPLQALTWSCIFGTLLILPFALSAGLWRNVAAVRPATWIGLMYLGLLATSVAYYWYYYAVHQVGAVAAGIFINLVPLFAVLLGRVFLDEHLGGWQIFGGIFVIAGVLVTVLPGRLTPSTPHVS